MVCYTVGGGEATTPADWRQVMAQFTIINLFVMYTSWHKTTSCGRHAAHLLWLKLFTSFQLPLYMSYLLSSNSSNCSCETDHIIWCFLQRKAHIPLLLRMQQSNLPSNSPPLETAHVDKNKLQSPKDKWVVYQTEDYKQYFKCNKLLFAPV